MPVCCNHKWLDHCMSIQPMTN
ncbi:hypothetical protein BN13_2050003 [Nostocoides jenkinsii Ben 74]|uniref:Uncharacterized protein n=1 Tax=Nostocoides jenkinsii Ben 74 TaxID=1193518 RepID=A0A077M869_9MICO|nr:hypothetical protein BN13_2050003 [Tetrasphaera jenkinsii Ben 74]